MHQFARGLGGIYVYVIHIHANQHQLIINTHTLSHLHDWQAQMKTDLAPEEMDNARQELLRELKAGQGSVKALAEDRVELVRCGFV